MRERRVLWVVLAAFVVGLVAVAGLAAVDDDSDGGPARLPALAGGPGGGAETAAASDMALRMGPVEYRVAGSLPSLPDRASAWDVGADVDADDVGRLASALGLGGDVEPDESGWRLFDGRRLLHVSRMAGAPWNLSTEASCTETVTVSPDGRTATPVEPELQPDGSCTAADEAVSSPSGSAVVEPCPMPDCPPGAACVQMCAEPERPADLPSKAEAERIGTAFLSGAGLDVDGADVRVDDGFSVWNVTAEPRIGGLPTQGLGWSAAVGPKGEIQYANGWLADPIEGDEYPLAGVEAGIERLKTGGGGWSPYPATDLMLMEPAPGCVDCEPVVRTITDARLGLMFSPVFTSEGIPLEALLVPSYFFSFDGEDFEQPVIAVADEYLPAPPDQPRPEPAPMPVEPGGGSGASCSGSATGVADGDQNQPMTIDVCVTPDPATVGEPVVFEVTYVDPDAAIGDDCHGLIEPDFGDSDVVSGGCAPACAADPSAPPPAAHAEPGRVARSYTHTYERPGTYRATFRARSGDPCLPNAYASEGEATVEVTVRG